MKKEMYNIVNKVYSQSIAEEMGIEKGDTLLKINGSYIGDIIDYKYLISDEFLEVEIKKVNGEQWILEIEKYYDEDLGLEFDNPMMAEAKSCQNKCIFCFIDQLPPNMRKSLYFKDDDSRLSFLHGNYITFTNMGEEEIGKLIQYRISPINISVHTTNGDLRKEMLANPKAANILEILKKLAKNNIKMNCQIVLCPNINDGDELDNTIRDLADLAHAVNSIAVVPVGITRYRQNLYPMETFDKAGAEKVINQIEKWQEYFRDKFGRGFVYLADEFYIMADKDFPCYSEYDGFPQLENGVGMVKDFEEDFNSHLKTIDPQAPIKTGLITILTGTLIYPIFKGLCHRLGKKLRNVDLQLIPIENNFFGGEITVSGLVTGSDILHSLKGIEIGKKVIIPRTMLRADEDVFLDDVSVVEIERQLGVELAVCDVGGREFINKILELL